MKKILLVPVCILFCAPLAAQKTVHKAIEDNTITAIAINASQAYTLTVKTAATPRIDIQAVMEGEYRQELFVNTRKEAGRFIISTSFNPEFKDPNDKLSVHKVISILMIVEVPENSDLTVSGGHTHITVSSTYNTVNAHTNSGNFTLNDFRGSGDIRNFEGDIFVHDYSGTIVPYSKYGKIFGRNAEKRKATLTLKTVNGNIYINKAK